MMFCMIDNYDSFTYNIVEYFRILNQEVEIFKNDYPFEKIDFDKYAGIILSPGPSTPDNSGITLKIIKEINHKPILGVCLGMQAIGYVYGANIIHSKNIMHGKVDTIEHFGCKLFENIPSKFEVVRYHSLVIDKSTLSDEFVIRAKSSDDEIMAISHKKYFLWGVQFHPESYSTKYGIEIIKNFIGGAYEYSTNNFTIN